MGSELIGRVEYETDANGARTGRWRPREGSKINKPLLGVQRRAPTNPWRKGRPPTEPVEVKK